MSKIKSYGKRSPTGFEIPKPFLMAWKIAACSAKSPFNFVFIIIKGTYIRAKRAARLLYPAVLLFDYALTLNKSQ